MINLARKQFAFIAVLSFALSACQSVPEKTVEIKVPVPVYVPCPITLPVKPEQCSPKDTTRPEILRCFLVEREQLKAYALELEAQIKVCAEN